LFFSVDGLLLLHRNGGFSSSSSSLVVAPLSVTLKLVVATPRNLLAGAGRGARGGGGGGVVQTVGEVEVRLIVDGVHQWLPRRDDLLGGEGGPSSASSSTVVFTLPARALAVDEGKNEVEITSATLAVVDVSETPAQWLRVKWYVVEAPRHGRLVLASPAGMYKQKE
jgi:hypothetical protein